MDRIEDCISFLVGKAMQEVTRRSREKLAPHGVTPTQYAVLKLLWDADGQSCAELGTRLRIDSATITGVVDRLESAQLLRRQADGEDRRVHRLFLTAQGRALREPLDAAMDGVNDWAAGVLGKRARSVRAALRALGDPGA
jgi:MarR family transcriptional regulator, organic hydroperoxide resistance regulator